RIVTLPRNLRRAVVEVYANGQINDEFWYTNPPNEYLELLNQTGAGNGAYREVLVYINDLLVGATATYPVIFSGGLLPTFWRPVLGIGALNIPSYFIDVTPFVGQLVNGKPHDIVLQVTDANYFWLIDANLHLWVDHGSNQTVGALTKYDVDLDANIERRGRIATNLDANFTTTARRSTVVGGWVRTSTHEVRSTVHRAIRFKNRQQFTNESNYESWTQQITQSTTIITSSQRLGRSTHPAGSPQNVLNSPRPRELRIQAVTEEWPFSGANSYTATADGGFLLEARLDQSLKRQVVDQHRGRVVFASDLNQRQVGEGSFGRTGADEQFGGPTTLKTRLKYVDSTRRCYSRGVDVNETKVIWDDVSEECHGIGGNRRLFGYLS
ncbi:peptide N-acetyl-beta-D-glucosaminyl asparaginase amidase A-domain-containing protein, partial [Jimgerdemannia flammicorona]